MTIHDISHQEKDRQDPNEDATSTAKSPHDFRKAPSSLVSVGKGKEGEMRCGWCCVQEDGFQRSCKVVVRDRLSKSAWVVPSGLKIRAVRRRRRFL